MKIGISIVEGPTDLPPVSNTLNFFVAINEQISVDCY